MALKSKKEYSRQNKIYIQNNLGGFSKIFPLKKEIKYSERIDTDTDEDLRGKELEFVIENTNSESLSDHEETNQNQRNRF